MSKLVTLQNLSDFSGKMKEKYAQKAALAALQNKVENLVAAGGEPNVLEGIKVNGTALTIAEKMVNILIATGAANGTIAVNGADVAVKGLATLAYKAKVSQSDLDTALAAVIAAKAETTDVTALTTKVTTLIGEDASKSVRTIANEELAAQLVPKNAKDSLNTLQEIAEWIQEHPDDASAMNTAIANLSNFVGTLPEGAASTTVVAYIAEAIAALSIGDYAKTSEVTTAINAALANYYTKSQVDNTLKGYVKASDIETVTSEEIAALFADDETTT